MEPYGLRVWFSQNWLQKTIFNRIIVISNWLRPLKHAKISPLFSSLSG